jgi:DNA/RNA-binding domain of Phe-tRNA-synthetase-like protein
MTSDIQMGLGVDSVVIGLVYASGCKVAAASADLGKALDGAVLRAKVPEEAPPERGLVRDMLRHGKYKPTGRGKPAAEYLWLAAREDRFPRINNLVDINNLLSLDTLLPISLIDVQRAGTRRFAVRRGRAEERYVFNSAGQSIGLEDLLLVSRMPADAPCANAVKDSMDTKVQDDTTEVLYVIYGPKTMLETVRQATAALADCVAKWSGGKPRAFPLLM